MVLFFTLDARIRFSIEERLLGTGDSSRGLWFSVLMRVGDTGSRFCQYVSVRGEFVANGDVLNLDAKGEVSRGEDSKNWV